MEKERESENMGKKLGWDKKKKKERKIGEKKKAMKELKGLRAIRKALKDEEI